MKILTSIVICFCLGFIVGQAQNPQWVIYDTTNSGLLSNQIMDIKEDGLGNIWIGSRGTWPGTGVGGGLYKFSSGVWTLYDTSNSDIPYNNASAIVIDGNNHIWFKCIGLTKFDGVTWTNYSISCSRLAIDASNNKWIASNYDLKKFDGINVTTHLTIASSFNELMGPVAIDGSGDVWAAIERFGTTWTIGKLYHFDGSNWELFTLNESAISAIAFDGLGNKWLALKDAGIAKLDGTNFTVYSPSNSNIAGNYMKAIAVDQAGNKWIGSYNMGLIKFDGISWTVFDTTNSGLPSNYVSSIYIDSYNNKWIGTENGGVAVFNELGVGIEKADSDQSSFQQLSVYPNPVSELITISFNVTSDKPASLALYGVSGRIIDIIDNEIKGLGEHSFHYNVSELINGVYYIRLNADESYAAKKIVVVH